VNPNPKTPIGFGFRGSTSFVVSIVGRIGLAWNYTRPGTLAQQLFHLCVYLCPCRPCAFWQPVGRRWRLSVPLLYVACACAGVRGARIWTPLAGVQAPSRFPRFNSPSSSSLSRRPSSFGYYTEEGCNRSNKLYSVKQTANGQFNCTVKMKSYTYS
jgi:hypothetical protein